MSNDSDNASSEPAKVEQGAEPAPGAEPKSAPPPASAPPAPTAEQKLAELQAEHARTRDQLLRTAADFDNFRKRSRRDAEDALRRGRESAIKDLLPVFDNLERAAQHADGAGDTKAVADGLRIVMKQFVDTLEKLGIKRIRPIGKAFDPSLHEAIQHLESAEHPAGVVMAEVQPGYTIGDQLLRAALVVVSKGAPAPAEPAAGS